jgi:hypothetical protein
MPTIGFWPVIVDVQYKKAVDFMIESSSVSLYQLTRIGFET